MGEFERGQCNKQQKNWDVVTRRIYDKPNKANYLGEFLGVEEDRLVIKVTLGKLTRKVFSNFTRKKKIRW